MYASDLKHSSQTLEEKLHKLYTLSGKKNLALDLFREPYIELLNAFNNPHKTLPPTIHVAGTNGKGSIIATLRAIYEAAGLRVHTYTSPHLIRFNERIMLAGKQITDKALESLIDETLDKNAGRDATFFEATTAMAFAAFSRTTADICLLETGLGGRLDCTNIIESPALTIINTIGMDHMDYLGDTIEQITAEKAGIIKPNAPCIIGHQNFTQTHTVFENKAKEAGANLTYADTANELPYPTTLNGAHQKTNINTALTAIKTLQSQFPVPQHAIEKGLSSIHWPARLQPLPPNAYDLPETTEIWLDGGHNADAGHALAAFLKQQSDKTDLILCMMAHKNPTEFLKPLLQHLNTITCTQIPNEPHSPSAQEIHDAIAPICENIPLSTAENYRTALTQIQNPNTILIAGSLYLAGEVLRDLEERGYHKA
ncbi:MAG: bifunctional folylpolyglutamate synthase/dihydrofolate synthase [Alphaproteobacteria bacterium]